MLTVALFASTVGHGVKKTHVRVVLEHTTRGSTWKATAAAGGYGMLYNTDAYRRKKMAKTLQTGGANRRGECVYAKYSLFTSNWLADMRWSLAEDTLANTYT